MTSRRSSPRIPLPPELAAHPFSVRAARARGVSAEQLRSTYLDRPFHGVRASSPPAELEARCRAYLQWMPEDGFFCSVTAALLLGVPLPRRLQSGVPLHAAVPAPRRAPRGKGIAGHKFAIDPSEIRLRGGLPVTTPERTWCDLASLLTLHELVAAGDHLVSRRLQLSSREAMAGAARAYAPRRGAPNALAAAALLSEDAESPTESQLRVILILAGIRGFVVNHPVRLSTGHRYRIDLAFPAELVALEYQGLHHFDAAQRKRDLVRMNRLRSAGWLVIEVTSEDLREPAPLIQHLSRVLARRRDALRSR